VPRWKIVSSQPRSQGNELCLPKPLCGCYLRKFVSAPWGTPPAPAETIFTPARRAPMRAAQPFCDLPTGHPENRDRSAFPVTEFALARMRGDEDAGTDSEDQGSVEAPRRGEPPRVFRSGVRPEIETQKEHHMRRLSIGALALALVLAVSSQASAAGHTATALSKSVVSKGKGGGSGKFSCSKGSCCYSSCYPRCSYGCYSYCY